MHYFFFAGMHAGTAGGPSLPVVLISEEVLRPPRGDHLGVAGQGRGVPLREGRRAPLEDPVRFCSLAFLASASEMQKRIEK